jgi:cobalt/nickel transport system permease protein
MPPEFLDPYSRGTTLCHRLPVRLKIVLTLAVILAVALVPISAWPVQGCLGCLIFAAHSVAGIPLAYLLRRLMLFLPFVLCIAVAVPMSNGFSSGWDVAATVVMRSVLSFLAGLWLVNVTPFGSLLAGLRGLGMPRVFASMLAFMYRYVFVLFEELARMRTAQRARSFGPRPLWQEWKCTGYLLGGLLIRALTRAERIHDAMCARGWRGEFRSLD